MNAIHGTLIIQVSERTRQDHTAILHLQFKVVDVDLACIHGFESLSGVCGECVDETFLANRVHLLLFRLLILEVHPIAVEHHMYKPVITDFVRFLFEIILDPLVVLIDEHSVHTVVVLNAMTDVVNEYCFCRLQCRQVDEVVEAFVKFCNSRVLKSYMVSKNSLCHLFVEVGDVVTFFVSLVKLLIAIL